MTAEREPATAVADKGKMVSTKRIFKPESDNS